MLICDKDLKALHFARAVLVDLITVAVNDKQRDALRETIARLAKVNIIIANALAQQTLSFNDAVRQGIAPNDRLSKGLKAIAPCLPDDELAM